MQRKLRLLKSKQDSATEAYGITIPPEISTFFRGSYFTIVKSGNAIVLTSGTQLTQVVATSEGISLDNYRL